MEWKLKERKKGMEYDHTQGEEHEIGREEKRGEGQQCGIIVEQ